MTNIISFMGKMPELGEDVYVDPSARIIGDVILKRGCSVWPMTVLRADSDRIVIEGEAAILDKVLIESPGPSPLVVGKRSLVSHGAMLHGCTVEEGSLVGIGAIVLDGAVVGKGSIIGAGSVVSPKTIIPPGSLVLGIPGKVVRPLRPDEVERIAAQVDEVKEKARQYRMAVKSL